MSELKVESLNITSDETVILALSGGIDSMVLLDLLEKKRELNHFTLVAVHINHGLRRQSDLEEIYLRNYCRERHIDFYSTRLTLNNKKSVEETARNERYRFLKEISQRLKADTVITAHHQNDLAETIFLNILRGTGLKGLEGINEYSTLYGMKLYRPLLDYNKEDIISYSKENNIPYFIDRSNYDNTFTRNRVRNEIFPYINQTFPNFGSKLIQTRNLIKKENKFAGNIINNLADKWIEINKSTIRFNSDLFINLNDLLNSAGLDFLDNEAREFLISELIRTAIDRLGLIKDFTQTIISNIVNFFQSKQSGYIELPNNLVALIASGNYLISSKDCLNRKFSLYLLPDIKLKDRVYYFTKEATLLEVKRGRLKDFEIPEKSERRVLLKLSGIPDNLMIRSRQEGDRIKLKGMERPKKLTRFFIDKKIPFYMRDIIPVISSDREILWIPNYYLNEKIIPNNLEEEVLELRLKDF